MAVYGLDIAVAGLLGAAFSVPGSAFRAFGGWLSDRIGARRVMYTTFIACIAITFLLSYPPTDYIVHGIESDIHFDLAMGLVPFVLLTVLLGFFMSLGNAAVYKHIPAYYPRSEEHTSELQSLMSISYAVFCLKKKKTITAIPSEGR